MMYKRFLSIAILFASNCLANTIPSPPTMVRQPHHDEQFFQVSQAPEQMEMERPFILECEAQGNPKPDYRWTKDGEDFDYTSLGMDDRIAQQPQKGTLVVTKPNDEDEGIYQCFAENIHGISVSNAVHLRKSELNAFPDEVPRQVFAIEGQPLSLDCNPPFGIPKPSNFWIFQKLGVAWSRLNLSSRITVDPNGSLHFTNMTEADSLDDGLYACSVTSLVRNEYKIGNKVKLTVQKSETATSNTFPLTKQYVSAANIVALRGQTLELHCIYGGTPIPEVKWSKKGGNLTSSRISIINYGKTLKIKKVDFQDEGTYGCVVKNDVSVPVSNSMAITIQAAPFWINAPNNTNTIEGGTVKFECIAGGNPLPKIKWFINGTPIKNAAPNARRKLDSSVNTLTIKGLVKSDTAVFQCNASNIHGYAFQDYYLNVLGKTRIIHPPENIEVSSGMSATFRCYAEADFTLTIIWLFNGQPVDFVQNPHMIQASDYSLTIIRTVDSDAGVYTCIAKTDHDQYEAAATLTVQDIPNPPTIVEVQCDRLTASIKWQPSGDRHAPILSYHIQFNTSFTPDTWEEAYTNIPASDTRFEVSMSPWANYTFRVIARNSIGYSLPSNPSDVCTTPSDVPHSNPEGVIGKGTEKDNLVISWRMMHMIEHNGPGFFYRVFWKRENVSSARWEVREVYDWQQNSIVVHNQPTFKPYRIKVEAHNHRGQSWIAAREIIGYSGEDVPLEAPQNFAVLYVRDARSAMLSWDPVSIESVRGHFRGYKIETWTADEGKERLEEVIVRPEMTKTLVTSLRPYSQNLIRILAFNMYNGPPSDVIEVITPEGTPGHVGDFDAVPVGSSALYLTWKKPLEPNGIVTGYRIHYNEVMGTSLRAEMERQPLIINPEEMSVELGNLKPKTIYRLNIQATTSKGQGDPYSIQVETGSEPEREFVYSLLPDVDGKAGVRLTWVPAVDGHHDNHFYAQYKRKVNGITSDEKMERKSIIDPKEACMKLPGLKKPEVEYRLTVNFTTSKREGDTYFTYFIKVETIENAEIALDDPGFVCSELPNLNGKAGVSVTWVPTVNDHPGSELQEKSTNP